MRLEKLALTLSLLAIPSALLAKDIPAGPWAGTWSFNLAKCQFPGTPPQVDQVTIQPDGTVTVNEVTSEGKKVSWTYKPQEGQPVPVEGRDNVTVLARKVSSHRMEQTWSVNGRPSKSFAVLSKDGKTQTFTMDGTDKDGKPFHEVVVYDKQ
jgi:hypothetical protein